jgi:hypothetical protein
LLVQIGKLLFILQEPMTGRGKELILLQDSGKRRASLAATRRQSAGHKSVKIQGRRQKAFPA